MVNTAAVRFHHIAETQDKTYKTLVKCIEKDEPPKEKLDMYKAVFPYLATKGNLVVPYPYIYI